MKKNNTDYRPKTVHVSLLTISLLSLFFFGLPVAGYLVFFNVIAPKLYKEETSQILETKKSLQQKLTTSNEELRILKIDYQKLKTLLEQERKQRAESEARATIAETAKSATGQQIASTETQLRDLKDKIAFYERLLKPKTEQDSLQCFNISASYSNKQIRYGISFLKNDPKNTSRLTTKVELRVLKAVNALDNTDSIESLKPLDTKSFSLVKDYRLSGTLNTSLDQNTLHILDIRVLDPQNKVIAKCWKSL